MLILAWVVMVVAPVPQPAPNAVSSVAAKRNKAILHCFFCWSAEIVPRPIPKNPNTAVESEKPSNAPGLRGRPTDGIINDAESTDVVIVSPVLAADVPAARGLLAKMQFAPVGRPEHAKVTGALSCPLGVSISE